MSYLVSIKTALLFFPIIALLFTIPFILHQYHKYGSINKFRVFIIYSFILYMITVYFLVILPLPKISEVVLKNDMIKLIPFGFINDFLKETSFVWSDPSTYIKALLEPGFYTVIFNILMTIPFGMYLRYYFQCSLSSTIIFTFFLSLFFEITQLTGLYFIYPYPYRVFDVDDLIMNTLGGLCGYYIMGIFSKILPTRKDIDEDAFAKGRVVSGLRRLTLFFLDLFIFFTILIISKIFINVKYIELIVIAIYYFIYPIIFNNQTLGSKFLKVKLSFPNYKFIRLTLRNIFIYIYYVILPVLTLSLIPLLNELNVSIEFKVLLFPLIILLFILFYLINATVILKGKGIFYDRLFKVSYESTIDVSI